MHYSDLVEAAKKIKATILDASRVTVFIDDDGKLFAIVYRFSPLRDISIPGRDKYYSSNLDDLMQDVEIVKAELDGNTLTNADLGLNPDGTFITQAAE